MEFVSIFGKGMMKNVYLPKISFLLQFGGEILALLCPGDSIQILLILSQFQTLRAETKLEGFVWSHHGITELISCATKLQKDADFWQVGIFHHALSEYTNKSHNFKYL